MPVGKDSIEKRVAKTAEAAPVADAATPAKAPEAAKPAGTAPAARKKPATAVLGNVSQETVRKTTGHPENRPCKPVPITEELPVYLL